MLILMISSQAKGMRVNVRELCLRAELQQSIYELYTTKRHSGPSLNQMAHVWQAGRKTKNTHLYFQKYFEYNSLAFQNKSSCPKNVDRFKSYFSCSVKGPTGCSPKVTLIFSCVVGVYGTKLHMVFHCFLTVSTFWPVCGNGLGVEWQLCDASKNVFAHWCFLITLIQCSSVFVYVYMHPLVPGSWNS